VRLIKFSLTILKRQKEIIVRVRNFRSSNEIMNGYTMNDNKIELRRHLLIMDNVYRLIKNDRFLGRRK